MTISDTSWGRLWWVVAVPLVCWVAIVALYGVQFGLGLSSDRAVWGQFSDYAGGLINPVISVVGLLAVVLTLRANAVAIDEARRQMRGQMFAESESHFVVLEQILSSVPSALKFHNIEPTELDAAGISSQEFGYLLSNFTAGGITARALGDTDTSPYCQGDYYRTMLESPHTRRAWPVVRRMMAPSPYKQRIQVTIDLIEGQGAASKDNGVRPAVPPDENMKFLDAPAVEPSAGATGSVSNE